MTKRATTKVAKSKASKTAASAGKAKLAAKPAKSVAKTAAKQTAKKPVSKAPASKVTAPARASKSEIKTPARTVAASAPKAQARTSAVQKTQDKKLTTRTPSAPIVLDANYRPSEDEPFMNETHRAYFRNKLLTWKEEIIRQTRETLAGLHEDSTQHADLADRATSETDRNLELRARDRQRKLISKIDAALARIEDGTYGYCEETGEPIGLRRLDARPIATLSVEAQERHERREKVYRED
jgi:DnaK suppressor protein